MTSQSGTTATWCQTPPTNSSSCLHGDLAALHRSVASLHDRRRRFLPLIVWHPSCEIPGAQEIDPTQGPAVSPRTRPGLHPRLLRPLNQPATCSYDSSFHFFRFDFFLAWRRLRGLDLAIVWRDAIDWISKVPLRLSPSWKSII